jgi:hypothetical protein
MLAGASSDSSALIFIKISRRALSLTPSARPIKVSFRALRAIFLSLLRQLAASLQILKDWREILSVSFLDGLLWLSIAVPTWFVIARVRFADQFQRFFVCHGLGGDRFGRADAGRRGGRVSRGDGGRFDFFERRSRTGGGGFDCDASGLFRARAHFRVVLFSARRYKYCEFRKS